MSAKHTPGPWYIHPMTNLSNELTECDTFNARRVYIGSGDDHKIVAETVAYMPKEGFNPGHPRPDSVEECEANARLIAAAPDLLANLEQMERIAADYLSGRLLQFPASVLPQARAAIAKATGEETTT